MKLKSTVELSALNEMHMKTIKVVLIEFHVSLLTLTITSGVKEQQSLFVTDNIT